jgi:hypothetical protein
MNFPLKGKLFVTWMKLLCEIDSWDEIFELISRDLKLITQ